MLRPRLLYVFVVCLGVLTILNGLLVTTSTEKKIRDADSTEAVAVDSPFSNNSSTASGFALDTNSSAVTEFAPDANSSAVTEFAADAWGKTRTNTIDTFAFAGGFIDPSAPSLNCSTRQLARNFPALVPKLRAVMLMPDNTLFVMANLKAMPDKSKQAWLHSTAWYLSESGTFPRSIVGLPSQIDPHMFSLRVEFKFESAPTRDSLAYARLTAINVSSQCFEWVLPEGAVSTLPAALADYPPRRVAACLIARSVEPRMYAEWLAYHWLMGVEHAVIMSDETSMGQFNDWLQRFRQIVPESVATVLPFVFPSNKQHYFNQQALMNTCLRMMRGHAEWVMFLDIDEYLAINPQNCSDKQHMHFGGRYYSIPDWLDAFPRNESECVGSVQFLSAWAGTPKDLPLNNNASVMIGWHHYHSAFNYDGRQKVILHPNRVDIVEVHTAGAMVNDCKQVVADPNQAFFMHYKDAGRRDRGKIGGQLSSDVPRFDLFESFVPAMERVLDMWSLRGLPDF